MAHRSLAAARAADAVADAAVGRGPTCSRCRGNRTYVGAPHDECERCEGTGREIPVLAARLDAQVRRTR